MKSSFTLNKKLTSLVTVVAVVAIGISAFLSFTHAEEILKEKTSDQLLSESSNRGNSMRVLFDTRIKETQILSTDPMIKILTNELNQIPRDSNYKEVVDSKRLDFLIQIQAFQELVGFSIGFEDVKVIGKDGKVYFSLGRITNDNFSQNKKFLAGINDASVTFESAAANKKKMIVAVPINNDNDESVGVILASMRTDDVDDILLNRSGLGETGEVYIVNEDLLMMSESRFIENAMFNQKVDTVAVHECFDEGEEIVSVYDDYRGDSVFGSSYCAKDLGFVLLSEIDEAETIEPVQILQNRIFLTGIIMTVGVGIVAYFLSKSLSRPLIKLRNAANEIAKGNFEITTNIKTSDEIGDLSSSFDFMAKKLQESIIAIKQREAVIKQQQDILLQFSEYSENYCVGMVDVVGSTKITANLTDIQTSQFYTIFINSLAAIIRKFDGVVVKNIGDALLYYFPKTNSKDLDSFKNMLECNFQMIESRTEINKKMQAESLPDLEYKISITYGPVRVAKVATSNVDDIFGATVNRCAKINRLAKPNGIVIGESLYKNIKSLDMYKLTKIDEGLIADEYGFVCYNIVKKS